MFLPIFLAFLLGHQDIPARFHGLAKLQLVGGEQITAVFRSEDLSDSAFVNRFHILLQPVENQTLGEFKATESVRVAATLQGTMTIFTPTLGYLECFPMDSTIRKIMTEASQASNGGFEVRWQIIKLHKLHNGLYEILIEEPKV